MKVNSIGVAIAVLTALSTTGCCWLGSSECCAKNRDPHKCCEKRHGVGVKASAGGACAEANVSTQGANIGAKTGL